MTPNHLAHLARPAVRAAEETWEAHIAGCAQCQAAPGPPPPDVKAVDRVFYACDRGLELHEAVVLAAHAAKRGAGDG